MFRRDRTRGDVLFSTNKKFSNRSVNIECHSNDFRDTFLKVFMSTFDLKCFHEKLIWLQSTKPNWIDLILNNKMDFFKSLMF